MSDQYIQQLSSNNSAERRQAIIALGKSGDKSALAPLLNVYKTDPDPELRELALKAGRYLKSVVSPNSSSNLQFATPKRDAGQVAPASTDDANQSSYTFNTVQPESNEPLPKAVSPFRTSYFSEPDPVETPIAPLVALTPMTPVRPMPSKEISYRERNLAKGRLDQAIAYRMQGNIPKAQSELAEAFRINPDLLNETVATNLATTLTGIHAPQEAAAELARLSQKGAKRTSAEVAAVGTEAAVPAHTGIGPLELLLQVVLLFGVNVLLIFLSFTFLSRSINALAQVPRYSDAVAAYQNLARGSLLTTALEYAAISTILTLFSNCVIFGVGIMLGGVGDLAHVLSAMLWVQIVSSIVYVVATGVNVIGPPIDLASNSLSAATGISAILFFLGSLGAVIAMILAVSRSHELSIVRSIAVLLVGGLVEGCIIGGLGALLFKSAVPR